VIVESLLCVTDHILKDEGEHWVRRRFSAGFAPARYSIASRIRLQRSVGSRSANFLRILR
jgi:hypothetical protein